MDVIIIGGGPAGMLAAISAAEHGNNVTIIEKNSICGKKLLITGKGRCNITSSLPIEEFINNIPGNGKFLYSVFNNFSNKDIINLLKKHNLEVKNERGNRVFPVTDRSMDVLNALLEEIKQKNILIKTNTIVKDILTENKKVIGVRTEEETIYADKVVLATGGKSYPKTGSDGNGYEIAKRLGHTITPIRASLVPLVVKEKNECVALQGLSLKNVKITVKHTKNNKIIYNDFGEMIFTHFGLSGPIILSSSAHILRVEDIDEVLKQNKIELLIDLKPALSEEKLNLRIINDFQKYKNKQFKNSLEDLLPKKIIPIIIQLSKISPEKHVNEITKQERQNLVKLLKNLKFTIKDFGSINDAIITSGGIDIKELNSKTMESKIIKGLFFAGEIIDVDAYTGGFNLQIAYSTGYTAGLN